MRKESIKLIGIFLLGVFITFLLYSFSLLEVIGDFLLHLGPVGPVLAGFLFAFTITLTAGGSFLTLLAEVHSPLYVALLGGLGGVLGDYLFFHIVRGVKTLFLKNKKKEKAKVTAVPHIFEHLEHSPMGRFLLPLLGAIIIASPFPDEFGVALLGISNVKKKYFILISYTMNTIGILLLIEVMSLLR